MNDRKTIAFYCDVNIYSGHDIMSAHIANILSARHYVHFFYLHPAYERDLSPSVSRKRLDLKTAGTGLSDLLVKSWGFIFQVRRMLRAVKPDIIIVCQGEVHLCLKGLAAGLLAGGSRVMSYIPIGRPYSIEQSGASFLKKAVYRRIVRRFHSFLTISVEQERLLRDYLGVPRPVHVLENLTEFPDIRIRRGKRAVTTYGIISRIQKSKGQFKTIEIAKKLGLTRSDFRFILFGEGDDEAALKNAIAENDLAEHFDFRGWVDDRRKIYSEIDVLLLLSEVEGVPLVFLEALFFETPVLVSRLAGNPIYERYVDPEFIFDSPGELADRMADIETYVSRYRRKSKEYRRLVIERHGRKNFERNLFELFGKL